MPRWRSRSAQRARPPHLSRPLRLPHPPLPHEAPRPTQGFAAANGDGAPPRERSAGPDGPL
eukprot:11384373-Alexandrium_andersonii.AAC.1